MATTRPETLFGDTAVAVHPDDERFRSMLGRRVRVPLTDRDVPIVADAFVDPTFGTGAVKITPAHDPNDFQAAERLGLPQLVALDTKAKMTAEAGPYQGLDRFVARERIVADLRAQGLLVDVQPHEHAVGHCQRCGTMIEPLVSTQWFVKIAPLAEPAIQAVEQGRTRFVPESWSKTYFEWMRNIHDWCISRQLWWGHRIPAWYCDTCGTLQVAEQAPRHCSSCNGPLRQDEDVLDTWFSSALWPFSTLGWPERTPDLERYYPTQLLITGHDIIFFWVARMLMMGLKLTGEVPFHEVYIHGLVRDEDGQKMSKSKGNTINPFEVQERYGTDAVRFTMAILAAPGNDIPLAPERMDGYRAFANKLWNATRFVLMKIGDEPARSYRPENLALTDRWILSRAHATLREVDRALERYRFDLAADALYHFVWHQFCDWYIEMVKPRFGDGGQATSTAEAVLLEVLDLLLRTLHPFMPFLTEELWHKLPQEESFLAVAAWPGYDGSKIDSEAERSVELLQEIVAHIRQMRAESNIDPGRRIEVLLLGGDAQSGRVLETQSRLIAQLVRAGELKIVDRFADDLVAVRGVVRNLRVAIPLAGVLDVDAERKRVLKDLARVEQQLEIRSRRLNDPQFVERAPAIVVQKERRVQQDLLDRKGRLDENLASLGRP